MHFKYPLVLKDINIDLLIRRHASISLIDYQNNMLKGVSADYQ